MRLNKFISETGRCSRREADDLIAAGRVTRNGAVADIGTQVGAGDELRIDGELIGGAGDRPRPVYIALNKPVGITCTTERHVEGNIIDHVDHPARIFPIGRLDKESEGLILLTNDGDIVNEVLGPSTITRRSTWSRSTATSTTRSSRRWRAACASIRARTRRGRR